MTQAEIDKRIAELQAEIEELERQRDTACPFGLPVQKSTGDGHLILDVPSGFTFICRTYDLTHTDYIARAINAYPAYRALREFVEAMEESEALVALDKHEYDMWRKALSAIANGEQHFG